MASTETDRVAERYARRQAGQPADRYSLLQPDVWQTVQERQRVMLQRLAGHGWHDLRERTLLEVGCGAGGNLLEFLRMGFRPEHLTGIELLPERHAEARAVLPERVALHLGDACAAPIVPESCDLVFQSTVFSSLLDDAFQHRLAEVMWRAVKPGGALLWYDFTVDNPRNRDVRGVPLRRVRELFPEGRIQARRVTLAPPLARAACRVWPGLYTVLNAAPVLRTHLLVWIEKLSPPRPPAHPAGR
jgi:SAM-dependent methyltransferase